jgi:DNA-binding transcriptional MerR regulator
MLMLNKNETHYNTKEAACKLGLSIHTLRKYIERGLIVPSNREGQLHFLTDKDLERFQKTRKKRGNPNIKKKKK